jgi:hypothetical protein
MLMSWAVPVLETAALVCRLAVETQGVLREIFKTIVSNMIDALIKPRRTLE